MADPTPRDVQPVDLHRAYCGDGSDHDWVSRCARCGYEPQGDRETREWYEARDKSAVGAQTDDEITQTYTKPEHGWTCFHCGETFTTFGGARDHFGAKPTAVPGCMVRVQGGEERGLLMALRRAEAKIERLRSIASSGATEGER